MERTKKNEALFDIFVQIRNSDLNREKKNSLIRELFRGEDWSWVVTGISKESLNILKANNFEKKPYSLERHYISSIQTGLKLIEKRDLSFDDWSNIIEKGEKTHIITKLERKSKKDYEYYPIAVDLALFKNVHIGFRYDEEEKTYLKSINEGSEVNLQKF